MIWLKRLYMTDLQGLFVVATFYYLLNAVLLLKSMGFRDYIKESWNIIDILTIALSFVTIFLWAVKVGQLMLLMP